MKVVRYFSVSASGPSSRLGSIFIIKSKLFRTTPSYSFIKLFVKKKKEIPKAVFGLFIQAIIDISNISNNKANQTNDS